MARLALIALLVVSAQAIKIDDELEMNLELIKHQPCSYKPDKAKWERKIEFEAGTDRSGPKLLPRPGSDSCYSIGGKVEVFSEFKGEFSIYLELRSSANKKQVPETCQKQRPDGCGGFGSCLYCNACETLAQAKGVHAQLLLDGKPITCGEGLKPGVYDNLELVFCLPEIDDILNSQGLSKETFKSLVQSEDGQNLRSMGIFATIYVFDTDVSKQMQTQAKVEAVYRKTKRSFFQNEPLPAEIYWSLPFNSMIKEQKVFVACHKIYGNIKIKSTS
ncbi:unnamed protein product [Bursaphelenchus xylophilus]|uniref:(pine wood nematode) hypothetical protein n=1 Tax=Bursaphelenchus xylophilus TaxID=6326 RepID=A0A1I7RTY0_BURXY|nr:unnamed protein product [Bursaphelenchus xylophilus]CAG9132109.1 unnamed protein product [Bursaphelenchus xylophilus]